MRLVTAFALLALGTSAALGQLSSREAQEINYGTESGNALRGADDKPILLTKGDRVRIDGSDTEYVVGEHGLVLPIGVGVTVTNEKGKMHAVARAPRSQHALTIYPLTVFSIGGELRAKDNSFVGGTRSVAGSVVAYDALSNLDFGRRFELGGFFFFPYDRNNGDLYQLAGRYFPNQQMGFQVAYLNSTNGQGDRNASSFSYHAVFDFVGGAAGHTGTGRISGRLGIGTLENLSKRYEIENNTYIKRSTFNFSTFLDLGYALTSRFSINATEWFVRDRNADLNRFAIGVSYKN